jgi:hypothetical protein
MLEELFEKAAYLRLKLEELQKLKNIKSFQENVDKIKDVWREYHPKEVSRAKVIAIDSGWNYRLYAGFYVYAIKVAAVDESMNIYSPITDMDLLSGDPFDAGLTPENFLKYQAEIYEHEVAYKTRDEADLILVDGSLISRLTDVNKRASKALQTEYMAYVKPLVNRKKLLFISKYSHDKNLLGGILGDVYYINIATMKIGYTLPYYVDKYDMSFSVFYVRLSEYSNALHVEVPATIDEEYIQKFIDIIYEKTIDGYPYVLRLAHDMVELPSTLMDSLCKTAGLTGWIEVRGVLTA